ncbi:hypothetical protein ACVIN2_004674 [Bradyrhizobium sp. USDA 3650]
MLKISCAVSWSSEAAIIAQTLHWPRHQAVEASAFAISSSICMKASGAASVPPRLCGSSAR